MTRWPAWAYRLARQLRKARADDWRRVPHPNWACSRQRLGGEYW